MINPETKLVALDALKEGRVMEATKLLTEEGLPLERAILMLSPEPRVGDILVSSWGYDQTNITYYQVVGVSALSVRIHKIESRNVDRREFDDGMMPVPGSFRDNDKPVTKRVRQREDGGYSVKISSYANAYLWDGQVRYQTGAAYGH